MDVKLKYRQLISVTPGAAGVTGCYVFRGNSTFDPDLTGTGHQPYQRDQIIAMGYQFYAVYSSTIKVLATMNSSYTGHTGYLALRANSDLTTDSSKQMDQVIEALDSKMIRFALATPGTISASMKTDTMLGWPEGNSLITSVNTSAVGTNPAQGWYWNIVYQDCDGVSASTIFDLMVEIEYDVRFFGSIVITQS
jgi:hypothetical protein